MRARNYMNIQVSALRFHPRQVKVSLAMWGFVCVMALQSLLFSGSVATAAEQDQFTVRELSVEGWTLGSLFGDFNGDGLSDVAIIYIPTKIRDQRRFLGLFVQDKSTGFKSTPTSVFPLPAGASCFQATDLDSDGKDEIVFLDDKGALTLDPVGADASASKRIVRRKTVYQLTDFRGALVSDFALELNGLPGLELVLPVVNGFALFEQGEDGAYVLLGEVQLKSAGYHARPERLFFRTNTKAQSYVVETPELIAVDANLDNNIDLYVLYDNRSYLFLQDSAGGFSPTPDRLLELTELSAGESCYPLLVDCNGDSRPDLVALRMKGGIASSECKVDFYLSDKSGYLSQTPGKTLHLEQARSSALVTDVNGDGKPELVLPAVELGVVATIKMMMQKKGGFDLLIYDLNKGVPSDDFSMRKKLPVALDYTEEYPEAGALFNWSADFNNDGIHDLVYTDGADHLEIFYGSRTNYMDDDNAIEITVPEPAQLIPMELNGDGKMDLIVVRRNSGKINGVWTLLNKSSS